ncbi:MAG: 3-oxoadipate enol-lactonase [Rhodobacteraceae bacterium]|jgi:3-oxoadipate enol-lactonase|uniref:3-oxoadipate enol-lactonase n=1 Tax=Albidovulum sp. TaxID=1872424 RepID=UPI001D4C47F8|nr:3-oxoadipate enol-lactonase [uncultured Defluviimonas sp.]MCB2125932.1 3-oxoadipate enol-lactonase [Paracoccaceae bacterium]MCC0071425.1 3-oxoadipate enol-lactonase [Paracoccaceae bacterium]
MHILDLGDIQLHWREDGDPAGWPVVFANALGTDFRLWDRIVPLLPKSLRLIRYDMRGHGLSSCPPGPYAMGALVRDAERLLDALGVKDCVFVGLSIGGMVAQGLAVKRLDLVRALVLSNTAAKIATPALWADRIAAVREGGIEAVADATMERWFAKPLREGAEILGWRTMVTRQPVEGYLGCMAAISGTDFYTPTSGLTLPALVIAGAEDGSTPPDLVRETAELIKGARFELIRGAGHLPCVDRPAEFAGVLCGFLAGIGHG